MTDRTTAGDISKEIVILASSYLQYKNSLYLATQNYQKCPITIFVTGNNELFKFLKLINEKVFNNTINLVFIESFRTDPRRVEANSLNKVFYVISDVIRERRYLKEIFNEYFAGMEGCDLYFLEKGALQFFLARKLRAKNRLIYFSSYQTQIAPTQSTAAGIGDLIMLMIYKLTYGCNITLGEYAWRKTMPYMPDRFLKKEMERIIYEEERDDILRDFTLDRFKIIDTSKYSAIYFFDHISLQNVSPYVSDNNLLRKEMVEVFNLLTKYFPEKEIACKYHPGYHESIVEPDIEGTASEFGDILPDFIPAELLYNDNVKLYLGAYSTALSNVEDGLVVSILDLITLNNEQYREDVRDVLLKTSHVKVHFPHSLDELEEILIHLRSNS